MNNARMFRVAAVLTLLALALPLALPTATVAQSANGSRRPSSRNQIANSSSGQASATGWNSFRVSHWVGG